jgi:hypothetical protein
VPNYHNGDPTGRLPDRLVRGDYNSVARSSLVVDHIFPRMAGTLHRPVPPLPLGDRLQLLLLTRNKCSERCLARAALVCMAIWMDKAPIGPNTIYALLRRDAAWNSTTSGGVAQVLTVSIPN